MRTDGDVAPTSLPTMTLRARVFGLVAVAAVVMAALGVGVWRSYSDVTNSGSEVLRRLQPASDLSSDFIIAVDDMQREEIIFMIQATDTSLAAYESAGQRADDALQGIQNLVGDDPEIAALITKTSAALNTWTTQITSPAISLRRSATPQNDYAQQAVTLTFSGEANQLFAELRGSAIELRQAIDHQRSVEYDRLSDVARQLALALGFAGLVLICLLIASAFLFGRWVLRPLEDLRDQLRDVASDGEHTQAISVEGPPEMEAAGRDAESMRRQLVAEIDEARAAREGLAQDAPLVAGIRRELSTPNNPLAGVPARLKVYGVLSPAEGVLAGDWWDCLSLANGEIAIVVGDVSGHGPESGIVAIRLRHVLSTLLEAGADLATTFTKASAQFGDNEAMFATVVVVFIDPVKGSVRWVNAGHPPPFVLREDESITELHPTGPLLCSLGGEWHVESAWMGGADLLLCHSDGLLESRDKHGEQLDDEGLQELGREAIRARPLNSTIEPAEVVAYVLAGARERATNWRTDDITLIAARRTTKP